MYGGTKMKEQIRLLFAILIMNFYEQKNVDIFDWENKGVCNVCWSSDLFMFHFSLVLHLDKDLKGHYKFTYS